MMNDYPYMVFPEHQSLYQYMNDFLENKAKFDEEKIRAAFHQAPNLARQYLKQYPQKGILRTLAIESICNLPTAASDFWYQGMYVTAEERHKAFACVARYAGGVFSMIHHDIFTPLDSWEKEYLVNKIVEWKHSTYAATMLSQQDFWWLTEEQRNKLAPFGVAHKLTNAK